LLLSEILFYSATEFETFATNESDVAHELNGC
jgi:hypothetical protein